jgi:hypothetical protein
MNIDPMTLILAILFLRQQPHQPLVGGAAPPDALSKLVPLLLLTGLSANASISFGSPAGGSTPARTSLPMPQAPNLMSLLPLLLLLK